MDKVQMPPGYVGTAFSRLTLQQKLAVGATPDDILRKELSLAGYQRPLDPRMMPDTARTFFQVGEFVGWIIEQPGALTMADPAPSPPRNSLALRPDRPPAARTRRAKAGSRSPTTAGIALSPPSRACCATTASGRSAGQLQDRYDSIGACAAATGIPLTTLKHAKRQGCLAFRGSRVYLVPLLRWMFESPERSPVNYDQERAQHVVLQNAKLKVELRKMRREVIPVEEVPRVGAELGAAIRKVVTRLHRMAPSLVGHPVDVIETRLKEEEDEILKQLHLLHEHLSRWEEPS